MNQRTQRLANRCPKISITLTPLNDNATQRPPHSLRGHKAGRYASMRAADSNAPSRTIKHRRMMNQKMGDTGLEPVTYAV